MRIKGRKSKKSNQRLHLILILQAIWLAMVCVLSGWWGYLILKQAEKIATLEGALGLSQQHTHEQWLKTQKMLRWESSTFFILFLFVTVLLLFMYWWDVKRTKSLQAFFASVTHELKTPLTSIRLQAEAIADYFSLAFGQHSEGGLLIDRLLEDTSRLEAQVERTLELARVEGGGTVFIEKFHMKPWLENFIKIWSETYKNSIQFSVKVNDCIIYADHTALQVIFKNIFENAIRHSKKENIKVSLVSEINEEWMILHYSDEGQTFNGDLKKLGQLFYKGKNSQGAGVGLYLVNLLVKKMGGKIQYNLNPNFCIDLWLKHGEAKHA